MKAWLLTLFTCASALANDLRVVGTNLYDFTSADEKCIYRIQGKISKVFPKSIEVAVPNGTAYQRYMFGDPTGLISPNDMLGMKAGNGDAIQRGVAVANLVNQSAYYSNYFNPPPIGRSEYYSLAPEMRKNYREITVYAKAYLLNFLQPAVEGQIVNCPAIATKDRGFFDCGIPFNGNTNQFAYTYVVTQNRIIVRTNSVAPVSSSPISQ